MYPKFNLVVLTLSSITFACMVQSAQAQPKFSQKQLVKAAQRFNQSVGLNVDVSAPSSTTTLDTLAVLTKIEYHVADRAPDDPTNQDSITIIGNHPHGYWRVSQQDKFHLEVDDVTGFVKNYVNYTALDVDGDKPAGEAIPKSQALRIAKNAIIATGVTLNNLTLTGVQEIQNHVPALADGHEWYVCWSRTFRGIPYRREGAGVFVAAESGQVISVRVDAQSIDPQTVAEKVTPEQALSIAKAQITAVGLSPYDFPLLEVKKEIVPFNTYYLNGDATHHTLQTRVVWNCNFGVPADNFEVRVDAETGDVIGGFHSASLGGGVKRFVPQFGRQLKHSEIPRKAK